jgi:hypothetical protein
MGMPVGLYSTTKVTMDGQTSYGETKCQKTKQSFFSSTAQSIRAFIYTHLSLTLVGNPSFTSTVTYIDPMPALLTRDVSSVSLDLAKIVDSLKQSMDALQSYGIR